MIDLSGQDLLSCDDLERGELLVEQGVISISDDKFPELSNPNGCEVNNRGDINGRVDFRVNFKEAPKVMVGLTGVDMHLEGGNRLVLRVKEVDESGFTYEFFTFCDTKIAGAEGNWIAIGY